MYGFYIHLINKLTKQFKKIYIKCKNLPKMSEIITESNFISNLAIFLSTNSVDQPRDYFIEQQLCLSIDIVRKYHPGINNLEFLEFTDISMLNDILKARFLYIKNLALVVPVKFEVPNILPSIEKALMYLSFNDYTNACNVLNIRLSCEIIGTESVTSAGTRKNTMVLKTTNSESDELHEYMEKTTVFPSFKIEPLNHIELIYIYIKASELYNSEDDRSLISFQLHAYLNRALNDINNTSEQLKNAFELMNSDITHETIMLEKINEKFTIELSDDIFLSPIIFKGSLKAQIGRVLMATYDYGTAYKFIKEYRMYDERIDCLIGMKESEKAAGEIYEYIKLIGVPDARSDKILISNLYIKLAHLYQNIEYFDMALSIFKSSKPMQMKGLWLFNKKRFEEAAVAFEQALIITPSNEEIRYSYGCTLVELDRINEALKIFRLLKSENPTNQNISKNLSYCYYKLEDVENMLRTLKSVALQDHLSMRSYLLVSVKNDFIDNVVWALRHINYDAVVNEVVFYLVQNGKVSSEKLMNILIENPYFTNDHIKLIFQNN